VPSGITTERVQLRAFRSTGHYFCIVALPVPCVGQTAVCLRKQMTGKASNHSCDQGIYGSFIFLFYGIIEHFHIFNKNRKASALLHKILILLQANWPCAEILQKCLELYMLASL